MIVLSKNGFVQNTWLSFAGILLAECVNDTWGRESSFHEFLDFINQIELFLANPFDWT